VFAYVQKQAVTLVQIIRRGQDASRDIFLKMGGLISGSIRFVQPGTPTVVLESPRRAELRVCGTATGALFGGHILVEAYQTSDQSLKGIFVRNGTELSGVTRYADENSTKFHILGFNDWYNRTYSGWWRQKDYGLDKGAYSVKVHIRGYIQATNLSVNLELGSSQEDNAIDMKAGGAIKTTLVSGMAWPCTTRMQMATGWIFFLGPEHYRARIYYYDENYLSYGFTERIIAPGESGVTNTTLTTVFSGMNHELAELIYWGQPYGYVPTVLSPGTYKLKAFAHGYVQAMWPSVYVEYQCASARINMLIGCNVEITGVLVRAEVFYHLVENVSYRADLYDQTGSLVGGQIGNETVGSSKIAFSCYGFGGLGHFFFVTPDGARHYDYGFGKGNYTLSIRRFGYLYRFEQANFYFSFKCLGGQAGYIQQVVLLNKIYGVIFGLSDGTRRRVSWATVRMVDFGEVSMSLDGAYWVFMPDGMSGVQFSLVGYADRAIDYLVAKGGREIQMPPIELIPV